MLKKSKSISFRVIAVSLLTSILVGVAFTYTCFHSLVVTYEKKYNDLTLLCNRIVAADISGDDILPYINALMQNDEIKEMQVEYYQIRNAVYDLEDQGYSTDSAEIKQLQSQMSQFKYRMQQQKDENYHNIQSLINNLKETSGAKYLYILADTGVPDAYTYIFDAHTDEETEYLDIDDLGTVDAKEGLEMVAQVLETGKQMEAAIFYQNGLFGRLNYAYAPIFDSTGQTVAVVGTDMDLSEMSRELIGVLVRNIVIFILIAAVALSFTLWMLRRMVIRPIDSLVGIGASITGGKVYTNIPEELRTRRDEVGELANTYQSVIDSVQGMISTTSILLDSAMSGRLTARSDPSQFRGDFSYLLEQFNATLDLIGQYSDNIPVSLIIIDLELTPLYQNRLYSETLGQSSTVEELVAALIGIDQETAYIDDLKNRLGTLVNHENYTATAWIPINNEQRCMSFVCCKWEIGVNPKGFLLIASDITELMLEKEKALQASRAKSEFLSRVSHELRTPLNTIVGMSQLGQLDSDVSEQSAKRLAHISDASKHLLEIINDVLDIAQIEAGKAELRIETFLIRDLLAELDNLLSIQTQDKGLNLKFDVEEDVPYTLSGDAVRLKQILINLTGNAVKFTETGGFVSLDVSVAQKFQDKVVLAFRVSDTGVGMSSDFLEKIFSPFEQEDQYIKRRYKGTGLGLSISFGLATLMGGTIDVKSKVGEGSEFLVTLPFDIAAGTDELSVFHANESAVPELVGNAKILLVDDIEINRDILKEIISQAFHFEIVEAVDGVDALEKFKSSSPGEFSMIFMDVQMPHLDGYSCTREIRMLNRPDASSVPIVAMTANAFKEDQEKALAAGMTDYLSKPVEIDKCIQKINRYCKK